MLALVFEVKLLLMFNNWKASQEKKKKNQNKQKWIKK